MGKFEFILMTSIWFKILTIINQRNVVLQAKNATIDVEVKNLESLLANLQMIRNQWDGIFKEFKRVANAVSNISTTFPVSR